MTHIRRGVISLIVVSINALLYSSLTAQEADSFHRVSIAHGGASQHLPFSSRLAFEAAIPMSPDYIETDVQLSKDGVLICFHDLSLERSTNVEEVFPERYTEVDVEGVLSKTWYTNDFTLAEIKQLDYGSSFDPEFADQRIVTFQELIDISKGKVGLYPETKDPEFYHERGLDIDLSLHLLLVANDLHTIESQKTTPIVIQSFNEDSLRRLRELGGDNYALLQLVWPTQEIDYMSDEGLRHAATYADGIGPFLSQVLPPNDGRVSAAHEAGLWVHVWQAAEEFPPAGFTSSSYMTYLMDTLEIDGVMNHEPDQFPR